jgi:hypothetical protein
MDAVTRAWDLNRITLGYALLTAAVEALAMAVRGDALDLTAVAEAIPGAVLFAVLMLRLGPRPGTTPLTRTGTIIMVVALPALVAVGWLTHGFPLLIAFALAGALVAGVQDRRLAAIPA